MSELTAIESAAQAPALPDSPPTREQIERLAGCLEHMPQVDLQTQHAINGGMYARTIFIPAGCTLVGAAHKTDHLNVMVGDITVWTEQGMKRLQGFHVLPTKAGAQRAGHAHADTWWTTICRTDETEIAAIEADLVEQPERLQTRRPAIKGGEIDRLEN